MHCTEFEAFLHPYVDGELPASDMAAAEAHRQTCPGCRALVARERGLRRLLLDQPRERAPEALRHRVVSAIRKERRRAWRPWVLAPALAAAVILMIVLPTWRTSPSLVAELIDAHLVYAQMHRPAEVMSADHEALAVWFADRAGMRVVVPDYSSSGIVLVGGRLTDARGRRAAYILYEKGHTLLSVFMVPVPGADVELKGRRVSYRGHDYLVQERKGQRAVAWADGHAVYGLVSALDDDALLECADRLRAERAQQVRI